MARRYRRNFCASCGQPKELCGHISQSGLCVECGVDNMRNAVLEIVARSGPTYELWVDRIAEFAAREKERLTG